MAQVKITELTAQTDPSSSDVLPLVSLSDNETKKVTVADLLENAGDGTVSAPAFSFDSQKNLGIYRPGADQLAVSVGGSQALLVQSSGVTVPGNLTIEGTTTTIETTNLVVEDKNIQLATVSTPSNTTADGGGITLKGATDKTITWVNSTGCWTFNQPMNFNDHVRIDSSGNVGIGVTSLNNKLEVNGNQVLLANGELKFADAGNSHVGVIKNSGASGNGQLEFLTGGTPTEAMRIDSSGSVGIGNAIPGTFSGIAANNLVVGSGSNTEGITVYSGSSNSGNIAFADGTTGNAQYRGIINYNHSTDAMVFNTASAERMRITSAGQMVIGGTSALDSDKQLTLTTTSTSGGLGILSPNNGRGDIFFGDAADDNIGQIKYSHVDDSLTIRTNAVDRFTIDSSGRLLMGSSVPGNADADDINVAGAGNVGITFRGSSSGTGNIFFADSTSGDDLKRGQIVYDHSGNSMRLHTNAVERMRIDSSGNVGINTTSPAAKLHTIGTVLHEGDVEIRPENTGGEGGQITLKNPDKTSTGATIDVSSANAFRIFQLNNNSVMELGQLSGTGGIVKFATAGSERLRIDSAGNVGIGISDPLTKLHLPNHSTIRFGASGAVPKADIAYSSTGFEFLDIKCQGTTNGYGNIRFYTNNTPTERMRITSSGNVGINNSSPTEKLSVNGALIATSNANNFAAATGGLIDYYANNMRIVATATSGVSNGMTFTIANSGTLSEAMRLDTSGRLLVGTSTARTAGAGGHAELQVKSPSTVTTDQVVIAAKFQGHTSTSSSECLIACSAGYDITANDTEGQTHFGAVREGTGNQAGFIVKTGTSNTEQMRIDSSGNVKIVNEHLRFNTSGKGIIFGTDGNSNRPSIIGNYTSSSDNNIVFNVTGSERMRLDASGNLGIGVSSVIGKLHANDSNGAVLTLTRTSGATSGNLGKIRFGNTNIDSALASVTAIQDGATNNSALTFGTQSTGAAEVERMRIDSSGNVGVGTTSPNSPGSYAKTLEVSDANSASIVVSRTDSTAHSLELGAFSGASLIESTGATSLRFKTNSSERLRIDSSGRVGIGSTSPGSKLQIVDTMQATANGHSQLSIIGDDNGTDGESARIFLSAINATNRGCGIVAERQSSSNDHDLIFQTSPVSSVPAERLRITGDGNVIVGTSSTSNTILRVLGSSTTNSFIQFADSDSTNVGQIQYSHANNALITAVNGSERMRINSSGNVGINTTSIEQKLTVSGSALAKNSDNSKGALLSNDGCLEIYRNDSLPFIDFKTTDSEDYDCRIQQKSNGLTFATGGNGSAPERMRIDSSGRLLVGTSSSSTQGSVVVVGNSNSSTGEGELHLARGATPTSQQNLGNIHFGAVGLEKAAQIICKRDAGTWTSGTSHPSRLEFLTTADGASTSTERMRIDSNGVLISSHATINGGVIGTNGNELRLQSDINANGTPFTSFYVGSGEKARIDSSGRLLVGTSTARSNFFNSTISAQVQIEGTTSTSRGFAHIVNSADDNSAYHIFAKSRGTTVGSNTIVNNNDRLAELIFAGNDGSEFVNAASIVAAVDGTPGANDMPGRLVFSTTASGASSQTERMRIASDGKISIGSTGDPSTVSTNDPKTRLMPGEVSVVNHQGSSLSLNRTGNNGAVAKFFRNGTQVGRITVDASSTSYVTSSDYRLKENVVELADGIARVKQLAPKRFNFIVDADTTVDGFLAHEAQAVVPEAVVGEKDGEEMQGIDQSKLVPLLTAALQEAIAKIETLEQRLTDAGL